MIVLHYTGMQSAEAALDRLRDPEAEVSAHYLIDRDGSSYRLVAEDRRAWHAGVSSWAGERDVNGRSIGIELVNPGSEFGYLPFPEAQMHALCRLLAEIQARHGVPAHRLVGHSDVAPTRKADPGPLFDWRRLAGAGFGLWPDRRQRSLPLRYDAERTEALLRRFGYDGPAGAVVAAFHARFRPEAPQAGADATTQALIADLVSRAGLGAEAL